MGDVSLAINGRMYSISCDDGQERRVSALGRYVDERLKEIARVGAATSEAHLLVLTSLVLADEIYDLREDLQGALSSLRMRPAEQRVSEQDEKEIVQAISGLVNRIDQIAGRLHKAA